MKKQEGITLIALVVTIVVLLILAGVTITMVPGEGGILNTAKGAADKTNNIVEDEQENIKNLVGELSNILSEESSEEPIPSISPEPTLKADGEYDSKKKVNSPKITAEMNPVYWDENNNEITYYTDLELKEVNPNFNVDEWYDYKDTSDPKNEEKSSHWANVKLKDGSYFVWIPRYAYQIESGYHTNTAGVINIDFLKGNTYESGTDTSKTKKEDWDNESGQNKWNVHPAFQDGSATDYKNGEWNAELSGIWIAKFEASKIDATATNAGSDATIKIQPSVKIWQNEMTINDIFIKCESYNSPLNSHLIKNSEWGAVTYLAHSKYGLNGAEIGPNQCISWITGAGTNGEARTTNTGYQYNVSDFDTTYSYKTDNGKKASTTGNVYGVYDMSGGSSEYVAAYVNNKSSSLDSYGESLVNAEGYKKDVYEKDNYEDSKYRYGDGIYEISGGSGAVWFGDEAGFPFSYTPFFRRGGYCGYGTTAGLFAYGSSRK